MSEAEEKNRAIRSQPLSGLESPFLEGEMFTGKNENDWEARLTVLETESSFRSAFMQSPSTVDKEDGGSQSRMKTDATYESSPTWQLFGEDQYEFSDTESQHELITQRPEPSGEEEDSAEIEYFQDVVELFQGEEIDEQLESPSDLSAGIANALHNSDWAGALKLAIEEGWRDDNKLTNLIFFARHPELSGSKLKPKQPKFKQLSREWITIRNREVWSAIQNSAENPALVVSGKDVAAGHRQFWGKRGRRFYGLIEQAAKRVDLNPGLLAATLLAETGTRNDYLTKDKVSSYRIGVDDFYDRRRAIARRVPTYAKIDWDRKQKPVEHWNDAKKPRLVKTINFDSGPDALLASAVYLKYGEVRLREEAAELDGDFDKLPLETRWALIRMAFNAGVGGATKRLARALNGEDILVRKNLPRKAYQTDRNATIHTARALHLSEWIFGLSMKLTIQPEVESIAAFDEEEANDRYGVEETSAEGETLLEEEFSGLQNTKFLAGEDLLEVPFTTEEEVWFEEEKVDEEKPTGLGEKGYSLEPESEVFEEEQLTAIEPSELFEGLADAVQIDFEDLEVGESEAAALGDIETVPSEAEVPAVNEVVFPSGESLKIVTGLPVRKGEDYWDPTPSGLPVLPLLDTGPTHKEKKLSKNFTVRELTISGGVSANIARIDPKLVECLQRLRDFVGKEIKIISGFRSWKRNRDIYAKRKKKPTHSQHCAGRAADIRIQGMNGLEIGKAAIDAWGPNIGVGLAETFAHIDVRGCAEAWSYSDKKDSWEAEVERYQNEKGGVRCGRMPSAKPKLEPIPRTDKPREGSGTLSSLPKILADAVRTGLLTLGVAWAIFAGERDIKKLTNMIFFARHPELPVGYKIRSHEKSLAQEWLHIRDQVVKPLLEAASGKSLLQPSRDVTSPILTLLLDRIRSAPKTFIQPRTRRAVVDGYERAEPRGDIWCRQAGLSLDEGALARMVASEVGSKPPQYMIAVVEATLNEAQAKRITPFQRITMQGLKLRGGKFPKSAGYFGRQSGRWCASIQDPTLKHLEAVRVALAAPNRLVASDARRWVDGKVMDGGLQAGKKLKHNAVTIVEKWGAEGWEWIGPVYAADGKTPLLDPYRLMLFRFAGRGRANVARGVEAMREGRQRWQVKSG